MRSPADGASVTVTLEADDGCLIYVHGAGRTNATAARRRGALSCFVDER